MKNTKTYKTQSKYSFKDPKARTGLYFILIPLILFTVFRNIPMFASFFISLCKWDIVTPPQFIGFKNYIELFKDKIFTQSIFNTFYYTIGTVPLSIILALTIAIFLNEKWFKGKTFFRVVYFLPVICSMVSIAIVWNWLFNPMFGLLNAILKILGLTKSNWLADPKLAMPCIILVSIWKSLGYFMIIFLAGLQGIPESYYEAATIDGANKWQCFRHITLPLLKPITFFATVMAIIISFQVFDQVYIMTLGGPVNKTNVIVLYLYNKAFVQQKMGYGASVGYVLFTIILIFTLIQFRLSRKQELNI